MIAEFSHSKCLFLRTNRIQDRNTTLQNSPKDKPKYKKGILLFRLAVQYQIVYLILIGGWISKSTILKYPDSEASMPDAKFTAIGFKASTYFKNNERQDEYNNHVEYSYSDFSITVNYYNIHK